MFKNDNLEYEFLPHALEIEDTPPSPVKRILIWMIFGMVFLSFIWSYFGKVDEVAVARGKVIPDGRVKVIQPMETGVIRAIHVQEGQQVKKGQILIELDPTIKQADVESTAKALSIHVTDKERLMEELNGEESAISNQPSAISKRRKTKGIFALQTKLKEARESEYKAREDALRLIISQRENALLAAEAILIKLEKTHAILKEQEIAYRNLYKHEYISKMDLLNKQMEFHSAEQEMEAQKRIVKQAKDSLEEARKNLDAIKKEREKGILSDIVDREKSITAIEGEVVKAKKRYDLERLCSPVAGTVHGLASYKGCSITANSF
ncbi:MAG: biotin/lipoyl-binding protein [Nitrospirota bacterium]